MLIIALVVSHPGRGGSTAILLLYLLHGDGVIKATKPDMAHSSHHPAIYLERSK